MELLVIGTYLGKYVCTVVVLIEVLGIWIQDPRTRTRDI